MRADRAAFLVLRGPGIHDMSERGAELVDILWDVVPGFSRWPESKRKAFAQDVNDLIYETPEWHPYESDACRHNRHEECGRRTDSHGDVWKVPPACSYCQSPCCCECHG